MSGLLLFHGALVLLAGLLAWNYRGV